MKKLRHIVIYGGLLFWLGCNWIESPGVTSTSAGVVIITDANFQAVVSESTGPVVVECWASWCVPCRKMHPVIDELAGEFQGRALIGKVDIEANPGIRRQFGIEVIPAFIFFRDGKWISQERGILAKSAIAGKLNKMSR